jgi:molecular chaperone DnaK
MQRTTVDFGIDLGTTNSEIAVLKGTEVEVIENNEGQRWTPSAVWIDGKGRVHVGRRARQQVEADPANAYGEFKLSMGTDQIYRFAASGREMKPEELSAEILKALRRDAQKRTDEEIRAAVISVPADFDLPENGATRRAARIAGMELSPLIQEPIAAALAYGFQSESDHVFWMVYDLGGGTFDAAITHMRDGLIQVVNHGGDKDLGGKLIDWEIVEKLLVPGLVRDYKLTDFRRGNSNWRGAFAKLKQQAEEAKIRLSTDEVTDIAIDEICQDDGGQPVRLEMEIRRSDIEPLIAPFVERSINICRKVLAEKRLDSGDVEKLILVGGPTLTPILRDMLAQRLGIPLEFQLDPLTVVARGAAIFAGTQRLGPVEPIEPSAGQFTVELDPAFKLITTDAEPLIGATVRGSDSQSLDGYTVELVESKTQWRSGQIQLSENGSFMTNVRLEKGRANEFLIELRDATGIRRETVPDRLTISWGATITDAPLTHSVGVALADGRVQHFFTKSTPLPARRREIHRTTVALVRGQSGSLLRIPIVEGENVHRDDRNRLIGYLDITGDRVRRDVPVGSEVEITLEIDSSRQVRANAYVPILDEEFSVNLDLEKTAPRPADLAAEFRQEQERLEKVREKQQQTGDSAAAAVLQRIDTEEMIPQIESSLRAAEADRQAAGNCQRRVLDLKIALDEAEDSLEWPNLMAEAEERLKDAREMVTEHGTSDERSRLANLEREMRTAIESRDAESLRHKMTEIVRLYGEVLMRQDGFWVGYFNYLVERKDRMRDQSLAEQLIAQGTRAMRMGDVPGLKSAVRQLVSLLPPDEQTRAPAGLGGGTVPMTLPW